MKNLLISFFLLSHAIVAFADGKADCNVAAGSYRTGTVVSAPKFASATQTLKGVGLSHTHIRVQTDQDGQIYDVAMDNVYATDYVKNSKSIPKSLAAIKLGDKVEMCGQLYSTGYGIHWVHDNCNVTPDSAHPDGFIKKLMGNVEGGNLESSQAYCYLWN